MTDQEWDPYWLDMAIQHFNAGKTTLSWLVLFLNHKDAKY